ncbi:DUF1223 domain-containing protein [Roseivivax sp. CAU 1761]
MLRPLALCCGLTGALLGQPVLGDPPVVVELFTSQGCSSCPPADALLAELAQRDDVIALALHVDYWDYIGWKDSFAQPRFTARQKGYARSEDRVSIYTPQMVVEGQHDVVGNRAKDVAALIAEHAARESPVSLAIAREADMLAIAAETGAAVGPAVIYLVRYSDQESVQVRRGENAGKRLTYSHVVTDWDIVGRWDGVSEFRERVPLEGDAPAVVMVQGEDYGPIFAAARLR